MDTKIVELGKASRETKGGGSPVTDPGFTGALAEQPF
jgi:hypothetical protein